MAGITVKATVNVRTRTGTRFPAGSFAAVLEPARASLVRDTERAFATASDPVTGRKWPPRKHTYPHPALVKSGVMKAGAVAAASTAVISGNTLTARVKSPAYAVYQAKGTRTIAARRFLGASIGTVRIVHAGLAREGRAAANRILRGRG